MPFAVSCSSCGSRFALTDQLYQRKVKGRIVTVRCKNCKKDISVDGVELASRPSNAPPEPVEEGTPTLPLAVEVTEVAPDLTPTAPLSRSASDHPPVEGLWVVSYAETDDRELTLVQIERALGRGEIGPDTIVWREGMDEWKALSAVPELAEIAKRSKPDKTGGLFGTGMSSPPPKPSRPPAKPAAEPETGPFKSVGAGTLFVAEDKAKKKPEPPKVPKRDTKKTKPDIPSRLPKAPPAQKREIVAEDVDDEPAPVSSGTPDLRSLTTGPKTNANDRPDDDIFGIGGSGALGPVLGPPTIDLSGLTAPATEPEEIEAESAPPSEIEVSVDREPKTRRESPRARSSAASAAPKTREPEPEKKANVLPLLLLAAAAALAVWWLFLRPKPAPIEPTPPAPTAEPPAEPVTTATSEPVPAPEEPAPSAEAVPTAAPTGTTAPAPVDPKTDPVPPTEKPPVAETPKEPPKEPEKEVALAPPFDKGAASAALSAAAGRASSCRKEGDPSGTATVIVTFAPSGRVTNALVNGPPFAGTQTGGCIAGTMRSAKVPAFSGDRVTVSKTVVIN